MSNINGFKLSPDVLLVGSVVAIGAFAVYLILKGGNQSASNQLSSNPNSNQGGAVNPSNSNASQPVNLIMPANTSTPSQSNSGQSGGSYYAVNYSPQSTNVLSYSPYNYVITNSNNTTSNRSFSYRLNSKQITNQAGPFGNAGGASGQLGGFQVF